MATAVAAVCFVLGVGVVVEPQHVVSLADLLFCAAGLLLAGRLRRDDDGSLHRLLVALWWPLALTALAHGLLGASAAPIGLAAGAVVLVRGPARPLSTAVALVAWSIAAGAIGVELHGVRMPVVMALGAIAALLVYRRQPTETTFAGFMIGLCAALAAVALAVFGAVALGSALVALGIALATTSRLIRGVGAAAASSPARAAGWFGPVSDALHRDPELPQRMDARVCRPARAWATVLLATALASGLGAIVVNDHAGILARAATHGLFVAVLVASVSDARGTGRTWHAVVAELAAAAIWFELRRRSGWLDLVYVDAIACIVATFVVTGVYAAARRNPNDRAFARAARITALVLPLLGAIAIPFDASWGHTGIALASSAAYAFAARAGVSRMAGPMVAVALNLGLFVAWSRLGLSDPQAYVLPVSASLIVLAQVYRAELSESNLVAIRIIALAAAYLSGFVTVLSFDEPGHSLLMATVCAAGVLLGTLLRIKSYLFLGAGFLVVDLGTNLVRFGLSGQTAATVVLTGLGLAILAAMVTWSLHRAEIERRLARCLGDLESWAV